MNVRDSKGFTPMTRLIERCPEAALVSTHSPITPLVLLFMKVVTSTDVL
jgi:hypothetical protein